MDKKLTRLSWQRRDRFHAAIGDYWDNTRYYLSPDRDGDWRVDLYSDYSTPRTSSDIETVWLGTRRYLKDARQLATDHAVARGTVEAQ